MCLDLTGLFSSLSRSRFNSKSYLDSSLRIIRQLLDAGSSLPSYEAFKHMALAWFHPVSAVMWAHHACTWEYEFKGFQNDPRALFIGTYDQDSEYSVDSVQDYIDLVNNQRLNIHVTNADGWTGFAYLGMAPIALPKIKNIGLTHLRGLIRLCMSLGEQTIARVIYPLILILLVGSIYNERFDIMKKEGMDVYLVAHIILEKGNNPSLVSLQEHFCLTDTNIEANLSFIHGRPP